jgi:hypothetical protein
MKRTALVVAGIVAGFLASALLSIATTHLLRQIWPGIGAAGQGPALETVDFLYAVLFMGVGGYLAGRLGGTVAAYALGGIFVILSVGTAAFRLDSAHSGAYQWLIVLGAAAAVWTGARASARRPPLGSEGVASS